MSQDRWADSECVGSRSSATIYTLDIHAKHTYKRYQCPLAEKCMHWQGCGGIAILILEAESSAKQERSYNNNNISKRDILNH